MDQLKLNSVREALSSLSPAEGLQWVSDHFGSTAKFSSSLGVEDQVITHWIGRQKLQVEIFTLDTGRLFQETYELIEQTELRYQIPVRIYFPESSRVEKFVSEKGINAFYLSIENRKECCHIRKVEPLRRALTGAAVWITGLRADQSGNRTKMELVEWDDNHQVIKYNPLLHWSLPEVEAFVEQEKIPINKLHRQGFPSIGCEPCTRAVLPGEDIRAGRWWWETSQKECGLHESKIKSA